MIVWCISTNIFFKCNFIYKVCLIYKINAMFKFIGNKLCVVFWTKNICQIVHQSNNLTSFAYSSIPFLTFFNIMRLACVIFLFLFSYRSFKSEAWSFLVWNCVDMYFKYLLLLFSLQGVDKICTGKTCSLYKSSSKSLKMLLNNFFTFPKVFKADKGKCFYGHHPSKSSIVLASASKAI
jgi:hypothetical protein